MLPLRLAFCLILALTSAPLAKDLSTKSDVVTRPLAAGAQTPAVDWSSYVPPTDGTFRSYGEDGPPELGLVKRLFQLIFTEECSWALGGGGLADPDVYDLSYRYDYETSADPAHELKLYRFFCSAGAYNEVHVYLTWDASWGLRPVSFVEPLLDVRYVDDDSLEGAVESVAIAGFNGTHTLLNSDFDPETQSIVSFSLWRGNGDASSSGTYSFREGNFVLTRYIADPSYDGEMNPILILDRSAPEPIELIPVDE